MRRYTIAAAGLLAATSAVPVRADDGGPAAQQAAPPTTLVVAISVDQLSADIFAEYRQTYSKGMRRLESGIVFPSGYQSHAATETCPGHSTILTGSHPARTGIVANAWIDYSVTRGPKGSHEVYCAEDETVAGTTVSPKDYVLSTGHLKVPTMGDRMKRADPRSRVVAVAGKDRAAIMMGGHTTDQMWFLDPKAGASYVTLPGRDPALPGPVAAVNKRVAGLVAHPPSHALPASCKARVAALQVGPKGPVVGRLVNPQEFFTASPEFDAATADIAIGLLRSMKLGKGPAPDLLAIGLSANDYVGHAYGTAGVEMCMQQAALDQTVGRILDALDKTGVNYIVVLTADHGGSDIPERNALRGFEDSGRLNLPGMLQSVGTELVREFNLGLDGKTLFANAMQGDIYLNPAVPAALRAQVLASARTRIQAVPQVAAVLTPAEIVAAPAPTTPADEWTLVEKAHASYDPARSGDLIVVPRSHILPFPVVPKYVSLHGAPWNYDRRVPMLFAYRGMVPHEQPFPVDTVDILPTLAPFIGLKVPGGEIDGRCIDLDPGTGTTCR